jgi:competence protein ComFC
MVSVLPPVKNLKRLALDLLFPRWCLGCGREGDFICGACRQSLKRITPPVCPRCGRPLSDGPTHDGCPGCAGWPGVIDGIRAPFLFDGVMRTAIHEFKYRNLKALAPLLSGLLYKYYTASPVPGDVLVPVPVHRHRLKERGYNQSALLARNLGKLSGLPVVTDCLVRLKHAPPQARSAGIEARQRNVAGAFTCRDGRLRGKHVILIDDVSTSGATLNTCAGVLKASGAATVWGLVLTLEL